MLLPVCTSTKNFHELIVPNAKIEFLRGRLAFMENGISKKTTGRKDLMLVIFDGRHSK